MADPLSVTCAVIAIVGAANSAQQCVRKLKAMHEAPAEIRELTEELSDLHAILLQVQAAASPVIASEPEPDDDGGGAPTPAGLLLRHVQSCAARLETLTGLIPDPSAGPLQGNRSFRKAEYWVWFRNRSKATKIRAELKDLRITLLLSLGTLTSSAVNGLQDTVRQSIEAAAARSRERDIAGPVGTPDSALLTPSTSTPSTPPPDYSEPELATADKALQLLVDCKASQAAARFDMTRKPPQAAGQDAVAARPSPRPAKKGPGSEFCDLWCSCQCHTLSSFRTSNYLDHYLGALSLSTQGVTTGKLKCDQFACRRRPHPSVKFSYRAPSWASARYMQVSIQCRPSYGPEIHVKLPRRVDWSHPLWNLAVVGNNAAIKDLFVNGKASPWDMSPIGGMPMHYVAERRNWDACALLLEYGFADDCLDSIGGGDMAWEHFLSANLTCEDYLKIQTLFSDSSYLETRQFTVLHKVVLGLLPARTLENDLQSSTAEINRGDASGRTCLSWAAARGDLATIRTLLDFGADADVPDATGRAPLSFARTDAVVNLLVKGGASIDALDKEFRSALHWVCRLQGDAGVVRALCENGVQVNHVDNEGAPAISNAAYAGHLDAINVLLGHGADSGLANTGGDTPLRFALFTNSYSVIRRLLMVPARVQELISNTGQAQMFRHSVVHVVARCSDVETLAIVVAKLGGRVPQFMRDLRDWEGKTAQDYLDARCALDSDDMAGTLRAAFDMLFATAEIIELVDDAESSKEPLVQVAEIGPDERDDLFFDTVEVY